MKKHYSRTILADINGAARSGEVTAIMGASGSGKTTLLNILAHRIAKERRSGSVELDGTVVRGSTMRRMSAYVMQDDLMFPALTVRETLMFAAELRLAARGVTQEEKERKVESLLDLLGLTKVADSLIGNESQRGVSGGERKRVAIGVEMVSDPRILFLDEPTSGLDSTSAYRVVRAIKDIAVKTGSIAIMVLHQPSFRVLSLIDRLLLLASGHTIFHGPPPQLPTFLASFGCPVPQFANSTEFALDLIEDYQRSERGVADLVAYASSYQQLSHMSQDSLQSALTKTSVAENVATPESNSCRSGDTDGSVAVQIDGCADPAVDAAVVAAASAAAITAQKSIVGEKADDKGAVADTRRYANGWMGELMVLTRRAALNLWRTPALYLLRLALVAVTGLMLATLYFNPDTSLSGFQERLAFFSFSICVLFFCCLDAVPIFIEERNIFIRETTRNAYRPSTYLVATTLVYLPLQLAMASIFVLENWWAINLTGGAAGFFFMLLTCFLILFSASSFAIAISVVVDHVVLAYAAGIALMAYFALVSGFYIPKYSIPNYWIWLHYLSPMKYAPPEIVINGGRLGARAREESLRHWSIRVHWKQSCQAEGSPGKLELFSANLNDPGSFDEAVEGCEFVCHVAAIARMRAPNPQTIIDAALEGTKNVFSSILKHKTARKVVLTSSVAAIMDYRNKKGQVLTEADWNQDLSLKDPYPMGKTLAEKYAWTTVGDTQGYQGAAEWMDAHGP
ncbi:unnamed protein product [Closterium sp. Naga37s-1]|nr:unnamed protein product [Closterium sp. Naga37s-1]